MLQALVFDVDGTLSETEELHRRAFNETFRDFGFDWHWDRELYCALLRVAGGKERLGHYIRSLGPDLISRRRATRLWRACTPPRPRVTRSWLPPATPSCAPVSRA